MTVELDSVISQFSFCVIFGLRSGTPKFTDFNCASHLVQLNFVIVLWHLSTDPLLPVCERCAMGVNVRYLAKADRGHELNLRTEIEETKLAKSTNTYASPACVSDHNIIVIMVRTRAYTPEERSAFLDISNGAHVYFRQFIFALAAIYADKIFGYRCTNYKQ